MKTQNKESGKSSWWSINPNPEITPKAKRKYSSKKKGIIKKAKTALKPVVEAVYPEPPINNNWPQEQPIQYHQQQWYQPIQVNYKVSFSIERSQ